MASRIVELDGYLETEQVELDKWTYFCVSIYSRNLLEYRILNFDLNQNYQDETQHRNADYISAMEQQMKDMLREEEELQSIILIL